MVYVPAGEFLMGSDAGDASNSERPQHAVYLNGFWIDRTEVSEDQAAQCVAAGVCTGLFALRGSQLPTHYASWEEARIYCAWVEARLPTEAEWEKAARGTDGRTYPWGNSEPNNDIANYTVVHTTANRVNEPVGTRLGGASPYGALHMAGNVWEWVADWFDATYYARSPYRNPTGPESGSEKVLRGGSANNSKWEIRASYRFSASPTQGSLHGMGFRCAASPGE
jgi:formylglycine-generating enzyme required for sulfatase activity